MQTHLLEDIGKAVIVAGAFGLPAYFLRIPLILAYIIAGVVIGPHMGFGLIKDPDSVANISEIGLVLLMFILGLEINIKKLIRTGRTVLLTGTIQIVGCFLLAFSLFYFFYYKSINFDLIYLSVALTLSSTLIVVKILSDKMDLDSLPSRITLGILVMQDLFAVGFLAIQPNLSDAKFISIVISLSKVGVLVISSWIIARYVLPRMFKFVSKHAELLLILAMAWCFSMCAFANFLNLSLEMGALIAGISIASFPYHQDVSAKIVSLRDFFITLFFVSIGLQIPVPSLNTIGLSLLISLFVIFSRLLTVYPTLYKLGYANRVSLLPTINLGQLSEFSLVFATIGITYGHIEKNLLISFIFSLAFTSFLSSLMIPGAHKIYKALNPTLEKLGLKDKLLSIGEDISANEHKPIVLLGFYKDASSLLYEIQNKLSQEIIDKLFVVDFNPEVHFELKKMNIKCQFGDISNVDNLKSLNLEHSELIICSISDKILKGTTNLKLLKILKRLSPKAKIIMTAENVASANEMYEAGATYVYLPRIIGANSLLDIIQKIYVNGSDTVTELSREQIKNRIEILS